MRSLVAKHGLCCKSSRQMSRFMAMTSNHIILDENRQIVVGVTFKWKYFGLPLSEYINFEQIRSI